MGRSIQETAPRPPHTQQPDQNSKVSRRTFLQLGSVVGGTALGLMADRMLDNERENQRYWFDTDLLREAAISQPGRKRLGFYPDFDAGENVAWNQVTQYFYEIGKVDLIGFFGRLEELQNPGQVKWAAQVLERIASYGAEPVYSIGTGRHAWMGHPFLPKNREILQNMIGRAIDLIHDVQVPTTLRLLYEANIPESAAFAYGVGNGMLTTAHAQAYSQIFDWTMNSIEERTNVPISLVSAPSVQHAVTPYVPRIGGAVRAHGVGLDGYALYPGPGQWEKLHYWIPGYLAPEAIFYHRLLELDSATARQVPLSLWELGAFTKDAEWLQQAALLLYAMGGETVMYFDYDKSKSGKSYETNWRMTPEIMQMFGRLANEVLPPAVA